MKFFLSFLLPSIRLLCQKMPNDFLDEPSLDEDQSILNGEEGEENTPTIDLEQLGLDVLAACKDGNIDELRVKLALHTAAPLFVRGEDQVFSV